MPFEGIPSFFGHWDVLVALGGLIFYLRLSRPLFLGFLLYVSANLYLVRLLDHRADHAVFWFIALFVAAWVGQFIGHHIEGKKPSFLKDVQFLMIGPAWLMGFIYRKLGLKY
jgi:uncharacterized membrane protein YGL010W